MSQAPKEFDQFTVTMDYKYVSSKFERWIPDEQGFGRYAGYNNGAIWKIGNKGARENQGSVEAGTINDNSVPKFFSANSNTFKHNGVKSPIVFQNYSYTGVQETINDKNNANKDAASSESTGSKNTGDEDDDNKEKKKEARKEKRKDNFDQFKKNTKRAAIKLSANLNRAVNKELKSQINIRLRLLNNTIDKIRNAIGIGQMSDPTNVYLPLGFPGDPTQLGGGGGGLQVSSNFFYDVRGALRTFVGDAAGVKLGGKLPPLF